MMLSEKIAAVKDKGDKYVQSNSISETICDIEHMRPHIDEAYEHLKSALDVRNLLLKRTDVYVSDLSPVIQSLKDIKEALDNDRFEYSEARVLAKSASQIKKEIDKIWRDYVSNQISSAKSIADSVRGIISDNPDYQSMVQIEKKINSERAGSDIIFTYIEEYKYHYECLMESLKLSQKVFEFLKKLNSDKTTSLCDLDIDSFNQLKSSHFADKLKIVIG